MSISKNDVMISIGKMRRKDMSDKQIMTELLEDKNYGNTLKEIAHRAKEAGSESPVSDVAKIFNLDITHVRQKDRQDNATIGEKIESRAMSTTQGFANVVGGVEQGVAYLGDKANEHIVNPLLGTDLEEHSYEKTTKKYKDMNADTQASAYNVGRLKNENDTDMLATGTEIVASMPFVATGGGAVRAGASGVGVGAMGYSEDGKQRMGKMAGGAIGGFVGHGVGKVIEKGVSKVAPKIINANKGRLKDGVKQIEETAEQHGVRTSVGDVTQGNIATKAETGLERLPVIGMSGFREAQHGEARSAAEMVTKALKTHLNDADYKAIGKLEQASANGERNAVRILDKVRNAGDDPDRILQASAEVKNWRERKIAGKMYDKVEDKVTALPNQTITPTSTIKALDDRLVSESDSLAPDQAFVKKLRNIKENIDNPEITKDFQNMRKLRSQLGEMSEQFMKGANPNRTASVFMGDLRAEVEKDITRFVIESGKRDIIQSYQRADKFYRVIQSKKDKAFAKAMNSDKPDEIFAYFVKTGKGDRAGNYYNNLDKKGQSALRYKMAENALDKAVNASTGSFSPARFAGEFERMRAPYRKLFHGEAKKEMDGFVKLMRHIERAGQYMENPPTGNRLIEWGMAGTTIMAPSVAVQGAGLGVIAKFMFTSEVGKKLLLAASRLPANEAEKLAKILVVILKLSQASGASIGGQ